MKTAEQLRLETRFPAGEGWKKWGPYLSERQWGTVREDYSSYGNAWDYFPHEQARSRAYRWGEDGIAGWSDARQQLCLSLALWNTRDPILKERLFGLTNGEGNHGEDVKESYYYLDATPTHSYLKMLYKYPQQEYPYGRLVAENRNRDAAQPEYELVDTGVWDDERYFDVSIEYAQAGPDDTLMRITARNLGPEAAPLHLMPQLWYRNTWSWEAGSPKPGMSLFGAAAVQAEHADLGTFYLHADSKPTDVLFCDNESNDTKLWGTARRHGFWKDAFHERVVEGREAAVNPDRRGTKAGVWYSLGIPADGQSTLRLRLTKQASPKQFDDFDALFDARSARSRRVLRAASAGYSTAPMRARCSGRRLPG